MADSIVMHTSEENALLITPHSSTALQNLKEATAFGVDQIIVGKETIERREVLIDPETGFNYSRNAVEGYEIYNRKTKKNRPWFLLELCTGKYGWYPGCEIHGDVMATPVNIMSEPSEESEILETINMPTVIVILDQDALDQEPYKTGWYKVLYTKEGYIKASYVLNLRYADPNTAG